VGIGFLGSKLLYKVKQMHRTENINLYFCLFCFFLAQFLYSLVGAGFGSAFLSDMVYPQFWIPWEIVKAHPWESLFYYHVQSPLFTAYTFLFALIFPPDGQLGIYFLHTILGLLAITSLYKIMRYLQINKTLTTYLILAFILSPSFNLYQSWGIYDFPVVCLILISTYLFMKFLESSTWLNGFLFFLTISILCNIRPLYHIIFYFIPLTLILLLVLKQHRKIILQSCLIPFLLILAPYAKNYYLFHIFTLNSWQGEVLSNATLQWNVTLKERLEGVKKGFFSDLALCPHTADGWPDKMANMGYTSSYCYDVVAQKYRDAYIKKLNKDYSHIAILNTTPDAKRLHRNVLGNIGMSQEYGKNAIAALIHYPHAYFSSINLGWESYFSKTNYFYSEMGNPRNLPDSLLTNWLAYYPHISHSIHSIDINKSIFLFYGLPFLVVFGFAYTRLQKYLPHFCIAYFAGFLFIKILSVWDMLGYALFLSIIVIVGARLEKNNNLTWDTKRLTIVYILCNIIYTTLFINFTTSSEENRYRFYIDALFLILLGLLIESVILPTAHRIITYLKQGLQYETKP